MRLGIDIGGTKIEASVLDKTGAFVTRNRVATPKDYDSLIMALAELVAKCRTETGFDGNVGVCMPGSLSAKTGAIKGANTTWLNGRHLDLDMQAALGCGVRLANDANCFALSEAIDGAAKGADTVFGVIAGTGCGGGLVVHGQLLEGCNHIAGEWGHNPLPWPVDGEYDGHQCWCGRSGCLETFISGTAFEKEYEKLSGKKKSGQDIVAAVASGDILAEAALDVLEDRMGRGLAAVINLFDPQVIVLGGGLSNIDRLYTNVPRKWPGYVFSDAIHTKLVAPEFGDSSGVRGAAWLWGKG
jgi:fructokinase